MKLPSSMTSLVRSLSWFDPCLLPKFLNRCMPNALTIWTSHSVTWLMLSEYNLNCLQSAVMSFRFRELQPVSGNAWISFSFDFWVNVNLSSLSCYEADSDIVTSLLNQVSGSTKTPQTTIRMRNQFDASQTDYNDAVNQMVLVGSQKPFKSAKRFDFTISEHATFTRFAMIVLQLFINSAMMLKTRSIFQILLKEVDLFQIFKNFHQNERLLKKFKTSLGSRSTRFYAIFSADG